MPRNQVAVRRGPEVLHRSEDECRIYRGQYEGVVRPHGDRYWFSVREMTRERSTIHGFGVDFQKAVTAVEQLLDLLERDARRKAASKQCVEASFLPDEQMKRIA